MNVYASPDINTQLRDSIVHKHFSCEHAYFLKQHEPKYLLLSVSKTHYSEEFSSECLDSDIQQSTSAKIPQNSDIMKTQITRPSPNFWTDFQFNPILLGQMHLLGWKPLTWTLLNQLRSKGIRRERASYARSIYPPFQSILSSDYLFAINSLSQSINPISQSVLSLDQHFLPGQFSVLDQLSILDQTLWSINSLCLIDNLLPNWSSLSISSLKSIISHQLIQSPNQSSLDQLFVIDRTLYDQSTLYARSKNSLDL